MTVVHHCVINQGVKSVPALCRSSYQLARSLLLLLQNSNSIATATILCISQQLVPALRALASLQLFHNGSTSILKRLQKIHTFLSTRSNKGTFDDNFASFDHLPKSIWTFLILNADKTGSFGPPALFSSPSILNLPPISGLVFLVSENGLFVDGLHDNRKFLRPQVICLSPLFGASYDTQ